MQSQPLRAWKELGLPLHMGVSQVLSFKYDMGVYVTTLFGGETFATICGESWVEQNAHLCYEIIGNHLC